MPIATPSAINTVQLLSKASPASYAGFNENKVSSADHILILRKRVINHDLTNIMTFHLINHSSTQLFVAPMFSTLCIL